MNFENTDFRQEILDLENPLDKKLVSDFLKSMNFKYDSEEVDFTMIIYNLNDEIIGTGSLHHETLKYVAVAPKFRESTAFPEIVTFLSNKALEKFKRCFVFTKPEIAKLFEALGYSLIAKAEPLFSVLEFGYETIKDYQNFLSKNKQKSKTDKIAAIVVNCNPFTIGHQYLIEKAASENEIVYLFVVKENLSVFPFNIRWKLIEQGISHLPNVKMISTGPYIVSGAIFPNYFLKNESLSDVSYKQAEIDVKIFCQYIAPILKIKKRYVGTENYCLTTNAYNTVMKELLPQYGINLIEIKRLRVGKNKKNEEPHYVSASKVRAAIKENRMKEILDYLPSVTKKFLLSEKSAEIRKKIKQSSGRH